MEPTPPERCHTAAITTSRNRPSPHLISVQSNHHRIRDSVSSLRRLKPPKLAHPPYRAVSSLHLSTSPKIQATSHSLSPSSPPPTLNLRRKKPAPPLRITALRISTAAVHRRLSPPKLGL
ncbi:hypothetical protein CASFOL_013391 [Castilleja foliolosa]|uniref:Uncharacterized protein n=1 Tax=Castilleja foliolosa TaxID=1961234 RepID=A0ABD3D001_9LAMI